MASSAPVVTDPCLCGHTAHWHSRDGRGDCEHDANCACPRFEIGGRCPMCGNLGWTLDCNDLGKPGPRMAEFMPCFHPECTVSGRPIQSVCFKGVSFSAVARHPQTGVVMSVSDVDALEQKNGTEEVQ